MLAGKQHLCWISSSPLFHFTEKKKKENTMASSIPLLETLAITLSGTGVAELAFNRPTRYNALSPLAYRVNVNYC